MQSNAIIFNMTQKVKPTKKKKQICKKKRMKERNKEQVLGDEMRNTMEMLQK